MTRSVRVAAVGDVHAGADRESADRLNRGFARLADQAEVLLLAGDLTRCGDPAEVAVLAEALARTRVPAVAGLGNHDLHAGREAEVSSTLLDAGVTVLEGGACEIRVDGARVGVAGAKGFGGGFAGACVSEFGEPETSAAPTGSTSCTLSGDARLAPPRAEQATGPGPVIAPGSVRLEGRAGAARRGGRRPQPGGFSPCGDPSGSGAGRSRLCRSIRSTWSRTSRSGSSGSRSGSSTVSAFSAVSLAASADRRPPSAGPASGSVRGSGSSSRGCWSSMVRVPSAGQWVGGPLPAGGGCKPEAVSSRAQRRRQPTAQGSPLRLPGRHPEPVRAGPATVGGRMSHYPGCWST